MGYGTRRRKHELPERMYAVVYPDGTSRTYVVESTAKGQVTSYNNWLKKAKEKGVVFQYEGEAYLLSTACEWEDKRSENP